MTTTEPDEERALRALAARVRTAGIPPPDGDCPDEDTLRGYRAGALDAPAEAAVDRHMTRCAACLLALRALAPPTDGELAHLAQAAEDAAGRARAGRAAEGGTGGLLRWLLSWPGRVAVAGALAGLAAIIFVSVVPRGGPTGPAPPCTLDWVSVSAERGGDAERTSRPVVDVDRPDAVVRAAFTLGGEPPASQALHAAALLHAPGAAHLREAPPLTLAFASPRQLDLALQAERTFVEGPGTYVLWIVVGTPESRAHATLLAEPPVADAEGQLLDGADAGRWSLQRLELRYRPPVR